MSKSGIPLHFRLLVVRRNLDWTQEKMAAIGGKARSTYSDYERGNVDISAMFLWNLVQREKLLNPAYLLGRSEELWSAQQQELTADEATLLRSYRRLSPTQQKAHYYSLLAAAEGKE